MQQSAALQIAPRHGAPASRERYCSVVQSSAKSPIAHVTDEMQHSENSHASLEQAAVRLLAVAPVLAAAQSSSVSLCQAKGHFRSSVTSVYSKQHSASVHLTPAQRKSSGTAILRADVSPHL
jgi:hypothetical protein